MDHLLARLARSEAATQHYENNSRTAARATPATALQQSRGSPTQNADGFSPAAVQAELVSGIIYNLLAARDDAFDILQAVAERLEPAVQFAVPGPVEGQQNATVAPTATVPDQIAAAFAYWRRYAAAHCRLLVLARSIQSRRSSSEPKVITATTWAERDAALRGDAVSTFHLLPLQLMSLLLQGSLSSLLPICLLTFWPLKTMPLFATSSQGALIEPSIDGAAERCTPPIIGQSGLPGASQVGPTATALSQAATFWIPAPF